MTAVAWARKAPAQPGAGGRMRASAAASCCLSVAIHPALRREHIAEQPRGCSFSGMPICGSVFHQANIEPADQRRSLRLGASHGLRKLVCSRRVRAENDDAAQQGREAGNHHHRIERDDAESGRRHQNSAEAMATFDAKAVFRHRSSASVSSSICTSSSEICSRGSSSMPADALRYRPRCIPAAGRSIGC
jgi:hypothetical protein